VITTGDNGVERFHRPGLAQEPAPVYRGGVPEGDWLVAIARTADGRTIWTAGMFGGVVPAQCAGLAFQELKLSTPLTDAFAGAALVDLDARVVGIVVRCDNQLVAVSADAVSRALASPPRPVDWLRERHGVIAEPLDERAREHFGVPEGLLLTEVPAESPLTAGDIIPAPPAEPAEALDILRNGRTISVRLPEVTVLRGMSLEHARGSLRVRHVAPASAARRAGVRAGDVLLSAGTPPVRARAAIIALLSRPGEAHVVFQRDGNRRGVLLQ
jgi:S1-C subfamily serine protease